MLSSKFSKSELYAQNYRQETQLCIKLFSSIYTLSSEPWQMIQRQQMRLVTLKARAAATGEYAELQQESSHQLPATLNNCYASWQSQRAQRGLEVGG